MRVPIAPHPCQHLVLSEFYIFDTLTDMNWYLIVVSFLISPITNKAGKLFLNFCVKYLFMVLPLPPPPAASMDCSLCQLLLPKLLHHKILLDLWVICHWTCLGNLWKASVRWFVCWAWFKSDSSVFYLHSFWGPLWRIKGQLRHTLLTVDSCSVVRSTQIAQAHFKLQLTLCLPFAKASHRQAQVECIWFKWRHGKSEALSFWYRSRI